MVIKRSIRVLASPKQTSIPPPSSLDLLGLKLGFIKGKLGPKAQPITQSQCAHCAGINPQPHNRWARRLARPTATGVVGPNFVQPRWVIHSLFSAFLATTNMVQCEFQTRDPLTLFVHPLVSGIECTLTTSIDFLRVHSHCHQKL